MLKLALSFCLAYRKHGWQARKFRIIRPFGMRRRNRPVFLCLLYRGILILGAVFTSASPLLPGSPFFSVFKLKVLLGVIVTMYLLGTASPSMYYSI